jgi:hypothetical protein
MFVVSKKKLFIHLTRWYFFVFHFIPVLCGGGHLEFSIKTKNMHFVVEDYRRNKPANFAFK